MKSLENITDDEDFKIEKAELSLKRKIIDQAAGNKDSRSKEAVLGTHFD